MKLSTIVHYLNELDKLELDTECLRTIRYLDHVFHIATAFDFQIPSRSAELSQNIEAVKQAVGRAENTLVGLRQELRRLITTLEPDMYQESTRLFEQEMQYDKDEYILNRHLEIDELSKELLIGRMKQFTDWRLPGMILRPAQESFILNLVPLDPLYLVDHRIELLKPSMNKFTEEYQRRLRPYVITEYLNNKILGQLPDYQFGFVLAYNFFNYKPLELIKRYLEELFDKLRPGGTFIMTYNDCDRAHGVALAERSFMCYTPGTEICRYATELGYELVFRHTGSGNVSWLELKRPGEISTIRGGQTLAKIIAESK